MKIVILASPETGTVVEPGRNVSAEETLAIHAISDRQARTFNHQDLAEPEFSGCKPCDRERDPYRLRSMPLMTSKGVFGALKYWEQTG